MAMLPAMLEHDRKRAGWSIGQAAWRLGVTEGAPIAGGLAAMIAYDGVMRTEYVEPTVFIPL